MNNLLKPLLAALCLAALSMPAMAQMERAYAPENLRTLSYNDQVRVISLEYSDQSNGRRIPDDQLRFYLDQVNRSNWGFSQIKSDIARSLGGGVNPPIPGGNIRCESTDNRSRTCNTPWQARSRLVRQLSQSACVEGRNWSSQRGQVTVWGGCRAEFAPGNDPQPGPGYSDSIRCESNDNRARTCRTNWPGHSRLIRQISGSGCVEGRTWQSQMGQVYVSGGCRAEFGPVRGSAPLPGAGQTIRCESSNNGPRTCRTPWNGHSRLVRQISGSACVEGRTWQSQMGQVYVSGGCRAEFAAGYGTGPGGGGGHSVTCASVNNRYTTCAWPPGQGTPRLLQQLSSQPCTQGRTWGTAGRNAIWVSGGCRGRFGN